MVVLDSNHTHQHVLEELLLYSELVTPGMYLVVADTVVEELPVQAHRPRPWGPGNNPKTAIDEFLRSNSNFSLDQGLAAKMLMSSSAAGYLRRR
jgi:cephalosporin hydroxylase